MSSVAHRSTLKYEKDRPQGADDVDRKSQGCHRPSGDGKGGCGGISADCPYIFPAVMGQTKADVIAVPFRGTDGVKEVVEKTRAANVTATIQL